LKKNQKSKIQNPIKAISGESGVHQ